MDDDPIHYACGLRTFEILRFEIKIAKRSVCFTTLKTVSELMGLSQTTVNLDLTGHPEVSKLTLQRMAKAAPVKGYFTCSLMDNYKWALEYEKSSVCYTLTSRTCNAHPRHHTTR